MWRVQMSSGEWVHLRASLPFIGVWCHMTHFGRRWLVGYFWQETRDAGYKRHNFGGEWSVPTTTLKSKYLSCNSGPSNFDRKATGLEKVVWRTLRSVGTLSTGWRLPARGGFCYLLLEVSGLAKWQPPGPDGGFYDPCLHPRTLAFCLFPREFLLDQCSLGGRRYQGHDITDLGTQKGSIPPRCQLSGVQTTHDNNSLHPSKRWWTQHVWWATGFHSRSPPLQVSRSRQELEASLLGTSSFPEGHGWRTAVVNRVQLTDLGWHRFCAGSSLGTNGSFRHFYETTHQ